MKKKTYSQDEKEDTGDILYFAKILTISLLAISIVAGAGYYAYQFSQKRQLVLLEQDLLVFAENAQKYVNLQNKFETKFDTVKYGSTYIAPIIPKSFKGDKLIHSFGGETVIGTSEMSGVKSSELFITLKDIPTEKNCVNFVNILNNTFPVIAVGQSGDEHIGINTGMFVKSNYANRIVTPQHLQETCFNDSQKNGKVNITIWFTAQTPIVSKNTTPSSIAITK